VTGSSPSACCALGAKQGTNKIRARISRGLLLLAILLGAAFLQKDRGAFIPPTPRRSNAQWAHLYAALPLSFEANRGQSDRQVKFLSRGRGSTLFLTGQEAVLTLRNQPSEAGREKPSVNPQLPPAPDSVLRLRLLGANPRATVAGADELPGKANYFIGNDPSKWHRNVPAYAKVKYQNVYPGVDLVYYGNQGGELEYDFVVAPGADPKSIALEVGTHGQDSVRISENGDLRVHLAGGEISLRKPSIYQPASGHLQKTTNDGPRTPVEGHYLVTAANQIRFALGAYDHTKPLVIDPVLVYASYVGGTGGDIGYGIAVDANFDAYVAGITNSSNFPTTSGVRQTTYEGSGDCFVFKMNAAGTHLLYSTYVGGSGTDTATAIAVSAGDAYVTGSTTSTDFPVAPNTPTARAFQLTYGGATDAFVFQLSATGSSLVYSTYLGGSGADFGQGIAVDSSGDAYVTGSTQSNDFPTLNPLQPYGGSGDAFITEVNFTGEQLLYSTFLGGSEADVAQSIQLDSSKNMYVTGYTFSANFPLVGPIQNTIKGGADAFVAKLAAVTGSGSSLTFSTFLGGSGDDRAYGVAVDSSQNVYVAGATVSPDFPTTTGAFQTALNGSSNAFVSKLNTAGSSLVYSTYLGGSGIDQANAIAVTPHGIAFVTGFTQSSNFPLEDPIQAVMGISNNTFCGPNPCADAFITQFNAAGNALAYSTYLGGNGPDFGQSIALDSTGDPYITGSTSSTNFPATSEAIAGTTSTLYVAPYKSTLTGSAGNAFVAKIDSSNTEPNISIVPGSLTFGDETISVTSPLQEIYIVNPSTTPLTIASISIAPINTYTTIFTETDNCVGTLPAGGGYCTMNVGFTPAYTGNFTDQITITDNAGGSSGTQQIINVSGAGVTAATAVTVSPTSLSYTNQGVGTTSPPQPVTITNTGISTLNITSITTTTTDFSETNTCLATNDILSPGQSCVISVVFSPTATGTRSGSLKIADTATGSPQTVALTGIGTASFSLTSPPATTRNQNPALIGATSTTFNIQAQGPTTFTGAITLACATGTTNVTCTFNPNPIFVGNNSVMTMSNLTTSLPNPFLFQVTGTSGSQTYTAQMSLGFQDYMLSATPSIDTIAAGTKATYQIIINPLFGFSQQISLSCLQTSTTFPPDATCNFSNSTPTPNGTSPLSVTLTINTVKYVPPTTHAPPRSPPGKLPPVIMGVLSLFALASLALGNRRRAHRGWLASGWLGVRLATLSLILALNLALVACRAPTLAISGTTTGGYTIQVNGTLVSDTAVIRYTTISLEVTASP